MGKMIRQKMGYDKKYKDTESQGSHLDQDFDRDEEEDDEAHEFGESGKRRRRKRSKKSVKIADGKENDFLSGNDLFDKKTNSSKP